MVVIKIDMLSNEMVSRAVAPEVSYNFQDHALCIGCNKRFKLIDFLVGG